MAKTLSLMLAQLNLTVGAIEDNTDKVLAATAQAEQQGADLLVCSELPLTGYPPEDLLLRADLMIRAPCISK
ncbi:MAG: NAD+ synthase, partial [Aeromonas sp.]